MTRKKAGLLSSTALSSRKVALNEDGRQIGEGHYNAKLTDAQVDMIRDAYDAGDGGYRVLAKRFSAEFKITLRWSFIRDLVQFKRRNHWTARHKIILLDKP